MRWVIDRNFRGEVLPAGHHAVVDAHMAHDELTVHVDAPYFGDPAPPMAAGTCEGLWRYEVVELFLAGSGEHYLEIELGPHGHHLVIELRGVRNKHRSGLPITYNAEIRQAPAYPTLGAPPQRFYGAALIPASYLTMEIVRANAYAIHGTGAGRTYCAHAPMRGDAPDFHALEHFVPCAL